MIAQTFSPAQAATAAALFVLVASVYFGGMMLWSIRSRRRQDRLARRLGWRQPRPGKVLRLWHDGRESTTIVPSSPGGNLTGALRRLGERAGMATPPAAIMAWLVGLTLTAFVAGYALTGRLLVGLAAAAAAWVLAWAYLKRRIARRSAAFEQQLVDAMDLAARSLRAGHPLIGAFRLISEEIDPPIRDVFGRICQEQSLGISLDRAMARTAATSQSGDLRLLATSIVIQLRSGGNLADMMDRLAEVVRDRIRLGRRVRVLTAQTQFSKRILVTMPLVVFVLMNLLNPRYMAPLYDTRVGQILLVTGGASMIVGMLVMNRMVQVRA